MPEVSRFYGIVIVFLYNDHEPPHFHAAYGDYDVSVRIADGEITGEISRRAKKLIREWVELHRDELMENWRRARAQEPFLPISPLE